MSYQGSIELIDGLVPANNQDFPIVDAKDVYVNDTVRLDSALASKVVLTQSNNILPDPSEYEIGTICLLRNTIENTDTPYICVLTHEGNSWKQLLFMSEE